MKKLLKLLLIIQLIPITVSSQVISNDTVIITSTQLKVTNLIFAEHDRLKQELPLMQSKINNLEEINKQLIEIDSIRLKQIDNYNDLIKNQTNQVKAIKRASWITVCGTLLLAVLWLIK